MPAKLEEQKPTVKGKNIEPATSATSYRQLELPKLISYADGVETLSFSEIPLKLRPAALQVLSLALSEDCTLNQKEWSARDFSSERLAAAQTQFDDLVTFLDQQTAEIATHRRIKSDTSPKRRIEHQNAIDLAESKLAQATKTSEYKDLAALWDLARSDIAVFLAVEAAREKMQNQFSDIKKLLGG